MPFNESQSGGDLQRMLHGLSTKPAWPQAAMLTKDAKLNELIPKATSWETVRRGQSRRNGRLQESIRGTKGERDKDTYIQCLIKHFSQPKPSDQTWAETHTENSGLLWLLIEQVFMDLIYLPN